MPHHFWNLNGVARMAGCIVTGIVFFWTAPLVAKDQPKSVSDPNRRPVKLTPLTLEQQEKLLARRRGGAMFGSFNNFASMLYAADDIVAHTDDHSLGEVRLNSPFPEFYNPTTAERFNAMARQMNCSWSYDTNRAYWVFAQPALPMPFKVTLAPGWTSEERGNYLFCKPPQAPIGMDIYVMAEFSTTPSDSNMSARMREATALMFTRSFNKNTSVKDMSVVKVGSYEALHHKTPAQRLGTTWRQWVIADSGQVIVIVSAIDDALEAEVLPGVEAALRSIQLVPRDRKAIAP